MLLACWTQFISPSAVTRSPLLQILHRQEETRLDNACHAFFLFHFWIAIPIIFLLRSPSFLTESRLFSGRGWNMSSDLVAYGMDCYPWKGTCVCVSLVDKSVISRPWCVQNSCYGNYQISICFCFLNVSPVFGVPTEMLYKQNFQTNLRPVWLIFF